MRTPTFFSSSTYSPPISMTSTLPGAQHGHARRRLGHLQEDQALAVGRRPPVVLDRLVDDAIAADVLDELPGPGGHRLPLGPSSPRVSMWRLDWMKATEANSPWVTLLPKATERLVEAHGDGVRVLDLHALDQPELRRQRVGRALLGDRREGEPDVLRRQLARAVVELNALAQVERPGAAAVRDLPALGQHGERALGLGVATQEVLRTSA